MRWDALFDDLEAQLHSVASAQQESEIRERTRAEQARSTLAQRLGGQVGRPVGVTTGGGRTVHGVLTNVGAQWVAITAEGRSTVVPFASLQVIRGLGRAVGQPLGVVEARLGLGSVLRALSRDRVSVAIWLTLSRTRVTGVIDRVGADFVELGPGSGDEGGGRGAAREVLTVPLAAIDSLDSAASAG